MKKFICVALILGSMLDLQALQLSQYHKYQGKNNGSFPKSFDRSTDLIRGIISLREGIFEQQRLYGNIDFVRMKSDTIGTCSYTDKGLDAMMRLLILTHPSSGGSGFNADGSGSIGQLFAKREGEAYSSDVIKIIATMFKFANEVRRQTAEILKGDTSLPSDEIKNRIRNVEGNVFQKVDAVNNIVYVFNEATDEALNGVSNALKADKNKKEEEKAKIISDAKKTLSKISGKTYAQLADDIRNLEKDIDDQRNEIKRLEKKEIKAYRKRIMEEEASKGQLEHLRNYENSIKEAVEKSLGALDTLISNHKISDSEDVKKAREGLEKLKNDITDTWKNDFDVPSIKSIISIRKEEIKKILNAVKPVNAEIMKVEKTNWMSKSFFGEYTNQLDKISKNIKVDKLTDTSLLDRIRQQKKVLESVLNNLIKENFGTIKRVTDSYDIALNAEDENDLPKIKKLIELTEAVSGAVLLERYNALEKQSNSHSSGLEEDVLPERHDRPANRHEVTETEEKDVDYERDYDDTPEKQDNNHPYWLGYANNIICAYACAVISGESADAQLEELATRLKVNRKEDLDYTSDLTIRLFQERRDSRSVIPFDVGVTPITNGTTVFKGDSYADCVETTMRQFCSFLFSEKITDNDGLTGDVKTDLGRIPDGALKDFFAPEGKVLDIQSLANDGGVDVREKWSNICGGHSDMGIWYSSKGANGGYELQPDWNSMIKLFCLLMKNYPEMPGANKAAAELIRTINKNPNYQLEADGEHSVKNAINTLLGIRNDVKFTVKNDSITKVKVSKDGRSKDALIGFVAIGLDTEKEEENGPSIENNNLIFEVEEKHAFLHRIDGKVADRKKNSTANGNGKMKSADKTDESGYFHIKDLYENGSKAFLSGKNGDIYTLNNMPYPVLGYFAKIKSAEIEGFHSNFRDMLMSDFGSDYLNGIAKIMFGEGINYTSLALRQGASGNINFQKNIRQLLEILKKNAIRVGELSGPMSMMLEINGKFSSAEEEALARDVAYDLFDFAPKKIRDYLLRIDGKGEKPLDMSVYEILPKYGKYIKGDGKQDPHPLDVSKITKLIKRKSALRGDVCAKLAKEYHDVLIDYVDTEVFEDTTCLLGILGDFIRSEKEECVRLSEEIKGIEDEIGKLLAEKEKEEEKIKKASDEIDALREDSVLKELTESIANLDKALSRDGLTSGEKSQLEAEKEKQNNKKKQLEKGIEEKEEHKKKLEKNSESLQESIRLLQTTSDKKNYNKREHILSFNRALGKILSLADLSKMKAKDVVEEYVNSDSEPSFIWNTSKYVDEEKIRLILPITKSFSRNAPEKEILDYLLSHKSEKYNRIFAMAIGSSDNKSAVLETWWNSVPQTEKSICDFLENNRGNNEIASSVVDYYKKNKEIDIPASVIYKIWTDFSVKVVAALMEEVKVESLLDLVFLKKLVSSKVWGDKLMETCRGNVVKKVAEKISIADSLKRELFYLIRYPLPKDALCAIADNICTKGDIRKVKSELSSKSENGKFILEKIGEVLNKRFKDGRIPLDYARCIVETTKPEELEKTLKRIELNLSDCSNDARRELETIVSSISTMEGINEAIENWGISLCENGQKLPIWFAEIIRNYLSEKLVDLIDLDNRDTSSNRGICKILLKDSARSIFMKKLLTRGSNIPFDLAVDIASYVSTSEFPEFLSKVEFNCEDKLSFGRKIKKILCKVESDEKKLHQVALYAQKHCKSENSKLPLFLAKSILLHDSDVAPFIDDFPPECPVLDNFFKGIYYFTGEKNFAKTSLIVDKFLTVDQIDNYIPRLIKAISLNIDSKIRNLLVKKISEKHEDPVAFLMQQASKEEDREFIANLFAKTTDLDAGAFTWGRFICTVDYISDSNISNFVGKIGNELKNMPINLIMFVGNEKNRRKLADKICMACQEKGTAMPYSLSTLYFMSDECFQQYFDKLDKTTFNKNDIVQLLSAGVDRELSEDVRFAMQDSSWTIDSNKKEMSGVSEAAQYVLQNTADDCNFDKQTVVEIVKAVRKADMESLKIHIK